MQAEVVSAHSQLEIRSFHHRNPCPDRKRVIRQRDKRQAWRTVNGRNLVCFNIYFYVIRLNFVRCAYIVTLSTLTLPTQTHEACSI